MLAEVQSRTLISTAAAHRVALPCFSERDPSVREGIHRANLEIVQTVFASRHSDTSNGREGATVRHGFQSDGCQGSAKYELDETITVRCEDELYTLAVLAMATGTSLDDLTFVGMVGIIDPERPQVEEAIAQLKDGGVIVKMITGDAEKTAKAIGERLVHVTKPFHWISRFV